MTQYMYTYNAAQSGLCVELYANSPEAELFILTANRVADSSATNDRLANLPVPIRLEDHAENLAKKLGEGGCSSSVQTIARALRLSASIIEASGLQDRYNITLESAVDKLAGDWQGSEVGYHLPMVQDGVNDYLKTRPGLNRFINEFAPDISEDRGSWHLGHLVAAAVCGIAEKMALHENTVDKFYNEVLKPAAATKNNEPESPMEQLREKLDDFNDKFNTLYECCADVADTTGEEDDVEVFTREDVEGKLAELAKTWATVMDGVWAASKKLISGDRAALMQRFIEDNQMMRQQIYAERFESVGVQINAETKWELGVRMENRLIDQIRAEINQILPPEQPGA